MPTLTRTIFNVKINFVSLPHRTGFFKHISVPGSSESERGGVGVMYAVIETGGKQYRVAEGDSIFVEKLNVSEGEQITVDTVLLVSNGEKVSVGNPTVAGAKVTAKVVEQGRGKKIIVFKYKAKKNYRKKSGHRQPYTKLLIEKIEA